MATTVTAPEEGPRESSAARSRSWLLRSIISVTAVAVAVVAGVALLADSDDETLTATGSDVEFTYVHEFDGNLDDVRGGPSLVATGGTFGSEGFVFERGDGLRAVIDLGDSYAIEFRIRIDESGHHFKLFDFSDLATDGGLYVYVPAETRPNMWRSEESKLEFYFLKDATDAPTKPKAAGALRAPRAKRCSVGRTRSCAGSGSR